MNNYLKKRGVVGCQKDLMEWWEQSLPFVTHANANANSYNRVAMTFQQTVSKFIRPHRHQRHS